MTNWRTWAVHLLTASGAALALAAMIAAAADAWQTVFFLLGIALVVDGVDGPLARKVRVRDRVPWFDGAMLDLVVDYTSYVLVPAFVLARSGLLVEPLATAAGIVIAVVGALYFADTRMKTSEQTFRGFPAVWNVVVYQLMVYQWPQWATLLVVALFAVLTFLPVEFVHPMRVKRLRPLTVAMTAAWALLAAIALADSLHPSRWVVIGLIVVGVYFSFVGVFLQLTRKPAAAPSGA